MEPIRIGTRSSLLALWQARYVASRLEAAGLPTELVTMETKGDKILDVSIAKIGSKGVFTEELEEQLRDGTVDIAVHSAKDLQSSLPDDLEIIAFSEREVPNDVLVSYDETTTLARRDLVVGSSSTRRRAVLRRFYPHVRVVDMRGNLQTRLRKLSEGQCDALLLAYAGVHRMGYEAHVVSHLPLDTFTPAVGQGSVAVEAARSLAPARRDRIREAVNHAPTEACLRAERAFLRRLQGGCSIPVFGLAEWAGEQLRLRVGIISLDGQQLVRAEENAAPEAAEALGTRLAEQLLGQGGDRILADIRHRLDQS